MTKLNQISDAIIRSITSGSLNEGDRLPSEAALATAHGVSVGTVQKALTALCRSGLIKREQGRGTFVSRAAVPADMRYLRFQDPQGKDVPLYAVLHAVKRVRRKGPWSEFLGDSEYVRVERTVNIGSAFDMYSEFWLREEDFAQLGGVDREALEKSLRELMAHRLSLPTLRVDQWIHFGMPPPTAANELGLNPQQPAIVMEMRGYTLRDRPLYYQSVYSAPFPERLMIVRE